MLHIPFSRISDRLFQYVCGLYLPEEGFPFPLQQGDCGTLFGSAFAALVAHLLDRQQDLPGRNRILKRFQSLEDPETGLFFNPDFSEEELVRPEEHDLLYLKLQTTSFARAALFALGHRFELGVPWALQVAREPGVSAWLDGLNWENPWLVSNLDMFLGNFLLEWKTLRPADSFIHHAVEDYFHWHDQTQRPETGFWGAQSDLLCAMAGGYHIVLHYDFDRRPLQFKVEMIDAVLKLRWKDGLFVYAGGGGSCEDMDAIDLLVRLSLSEQYRTLAINRVLMEAASMLAVAQNSDGGFSWRVHPRVTKIRAALVQGGTKTAKGLAWSKLSSLIRRSHFHSTHYYSSCAAYPYHILQSDLWSSWFRPLALAMVAQRYPEEFSEPCSWQMPHWPGLGFNPFAHSGLL